MKLKADDIIFCALVILAIAAMMQIAGEATETAAVSGTGARAVDLDLILRKIESGELSAREAEFYKPAATQGAGESQ